MARGELVELAPIEGEKVAKWNRRCAGCASGKRGAGRPTSFRARRNGGRHLRRGQLARGLPNQARSHPCRGIRRTAPLVSPTDEGVSAWRTYCSGYY
jgi:hypothetical protein